MPTDFYLRLHVNESSSSEEYAWYVSPFGQLNAKILLDSFFLKSFYINSSCYNTPSQPAKDWTGVGELTESQHNNESKVGSYGNGYGCFRCLNDIGTMLSYQYFVLL